VRLAALAGFAAACATPTDSAVAEVDAACVDAPAADWETFGAAFVDGNCDICHAASTPDRHEAPESVHFDTVEEAWAWAPAILALAGSEPPQMPPLGGTQPEDRVLLRAWLACGEEGK
jgi:uncharacterized membrane protein